MRGEQTRRAVEARIGAVERLWAPRAVRSADGPSAGRRWIDLRGLGGLDVTVEADQFLDLGQASYRGVPFSFTPSTTSTIAESWLRRWRGGLLTTCGLTAVGVAPPEDGGMHGRAQLVAATVTRCEGRWVGDRYEVVVGGLLREGAVFAQNLTVERTITGVIGEAALRIHDVVRNEGFGAEPVKLLYHVNVGWPALEQGAVVTAQADAAIASDADGEPGRWRRTIAAPEPLEPELVDALVAVPDAHGWSEARIDGGAHPFVVRYRPEQLPYCTIWRGTASGSYALGIEPGTCWPSHVPGPELGKGGRMLGAGESFEVDLELSVPD